MKYLIGLRKNMEYNVVLTDQAEAQLESIADYIKYKLQEPMTALGIVRGIRKEIKKLSANPAMHGLYEDVILAKIGIRKQYYKNYIVFYRIQEKSNIVEVVAILHMRVDAKAILYDFI